MCMTHAATVLARLGDRALVELNGRDRLVDSLMVPDVLPGENVLIGMGCVLARISAAEADRIRAEDATQGPAGEP
jgi:hydrogenase maturation factor